MALKLTIMANDAPCLPQEIITRILVRLPVKSLIRFQCVCKEWKNLFKTPSFIADHLHHSTQQNSLLVVDCIISESNHWHLRCLNREMQVVEFQNQHPHIIGSQIRSVCSSNGLLLVNLVVESQHSLWLWNPSIRALRQVPNSLINHEFQEYSVGFGFSSTTNDYKIVKLFTCNRGIVKGEVYSLRTGLWREVELRNLEGICVPIYKGFTGNGAVFWFGVKVKVNLVVIVSFDMAMEVCTLMPYPGTFSPRNGFALYKNRIAMVSFTWNENDRTELIDLWVLEESTDPSRERWSWTKLYTIKPNPYRIDPNSGFVWRNEIVGFGWPENEDFIEGEQEENHEPHIVLCNLTTNDFNMFPIPRESCIFDVFDHVESLVWLNNNHI